MFVLEIRVRYMFVCCLDTCSHITCNIANILKYAKVFTYMDTSYTISFPANILIKIH